jgi:hypothetical protein
MNLLNRILVVLSLIALIILSLLLMVSMLFLRPGIRNFFQTTPLLATDSALNGPQVVFLGILVLVFAFAILLTLLEMLPGSVKRVKVLSVQGAEVLMSADAVTQQLDFALDALANVIKVRTQIVGTNKGKGMDVFVELWTTPDVDVKAKTEEAAGVARQVIEDKLGLQVGRVQIKLDQMKAPLTKGAKQVLSKSTSAGIKS